MGIKVYYFLVLAVMLFGILMPQKGPKRKRYIVLMALLHAFVSGFRYMYLTGDLMKYSGSYYRAPEFGWFSSEIFHEGRNFGFHWLEKIFSSLTDGNFQVFLVFVAIVVEAGVAFVVYRYSPNPMLSYLIWNSFGFYIFGLSALKQSLAMGLLCFAFAGLMEKKPGMFLFWTVLAGTIHAPAMIFLPAYWITRGRLNGIKAIALIAAGILIYIYRDQVVVYMSQFYFEDHGEFISYGRLGGRFLRLFLGGLFRLLFHRLFGLLFLTLFLFGMRRLGRRLFFLLQLITAVGDTDTGGVAPQT